MNEDLEFDTGGGTNRLNVFDAQLSGQHHATRPGFSDDFGCLGAGGGHLRAGMDRQSRREFAGEFDHAQILYDDRVRARRNPKKFILEPCEFRIKDERVDRHESHHAAFVQFTHHVRQGRVRETHRFGTGVKTLEPEVDGIGSGFDGGPQLRQASGGTHQFWLA